MTSEKQKLAMVKRYISAYNSFDADGMLKDLAKEIIFKNISNGEIDLITNGSSEFKEQAEKAKSFFSERKQKVMASNFKSDELHIEIDYSGTLAIDIPNGLKKGQTLELKGKSIFKFENGEIIEINDIS